MKAGFLLFVVVSVILSSQSPAQQRTKPPAAEEYVCLDTVVKATTKDGNTIFPLMNSRGSECETVVMPSPLSEQDRSLLSKLTIDANNVDALRTSDQIRESGGQAKTWTPLIKDMVKAFQQTRAQFCSGHPDMFVYQLQDDGERTAPRPCSSK